MFRPRRPLAVAVVGAGATAAGIATRLSLGGHQVATSLSALPARPGQRVLWLTEAVDDAGLAALERSLAPGDVVIDGSDGSVESAVALASALGRKRVDVLDVGVSGAADGTARGFGLAIGGTARAVARATPAFQSVAPGARRGWAHIRDDRGRGVVGGGRLVRTVEAAVDNAFRVALREGLDVLARGSIQVDPAVALGAWERGSILSSELVGATLDLVSDGGSYRSVSERDVRPGQAVYDAAIESGKPTYTLSSALFEQLRRPRVTADVASARAVRSGDSGRQSLSRTSPRVHRPKRPVAVGVVGLGRMGGGVARRLLLGGHDVVGFDLAAAGREAVAGAGGRATDSIERMVDSLPRVKGLPRAVFVYLPAGDVTERAVRRLGELLEPGDIIVDGGNSLYSDSIALGQELAAKGIDLVDVGTSGGVLGFENGYAMMVGGPNRAVEHLTPAFQSLAPGASTGWAHIRDRRGRGITGGGHLTKMVHNAIEYAWMSSLAEGLDLLGRGPSKVDRRTVLKVWDERGPLAGLITAVTRRQLAADPEFAQLTNKVPDTGEGRATVRYAAQSGIPIQTLNAGLQQRLSSQALLDDTTDIGRVQAQQRRGFGGHKPDLAKK